MDHCLAEVDPYGLPDLLASAANGGVIYDPSKVGECHDRFQRDPCHFAFFLFTPDIFEVLAECPGTITPQRHSGEACVSGGECVAGLYCQKTNGLCPGSCVAYASDGESCATKQCAPNHMCTEEVCQPFAKAGDPCSGSSDCGPTIICLGAPGCVDDSLWCDLGSGTCKVGAGEGEPCGVQKVGTASMNVECQNALWCDAVFIDKPGFCRKPGREGAPCTDLGGCEKGYHCIGYVGFGTGAQLGTCAAQGALGAECTFNSDCQSGLRCANEVCATFAQLGEACSGTSDCAMGLTCVNRVCETAKYPGDACGTSDSCVLSLCKGDQCVDHAKVGQACATYGDCTTQTCVNGKCVDDSVCAVQ
jgi:hypothetical protein